MPTTNRTNKANGTDPRSKAALPEARYDLTSNHNFTARPKTNEFWRSAHGMDGFVLSNIATN